VGGKGTGPFFGRPSVSKACFLAERRTNSRPVNDHLAFSGSRFAAIVRSRFVTVSFQ
jgi:hypothetical protein